MAWRLELQCLQHPALQGVLLIATTLVAVLLLVLTQTELHLNNNSLSHDTHWVMPAQQANSSRAFNTRLGTDQQQQQQRQQQQPQKKGNQPLGRKPTGPSPRPAATATSSVLSGLIGRDVPHVLRNIGRLAARFQQAGSNQPQLAQQAAAGQGPPVGGPASTATSSVMFGLIGRDVASELPYVLRNIGQLAARFQEAHVVFVENDSKDATRAVFQSWAADFAQSSRSNRTARLVTLEVKEAGPKEMDVLAKARNAYIQQLSRPEYVNVSLLLAVDTDMCFAWDVDNMVKVIDDLLPAMSTQWHVLTANGVCGWRSSQGKQGTEVQVPPHTPGAVPDYCDRLALVTKPGGRVITEGKLAFVPGSCDLSYMSSDAASEFSCRFINGQPVVPVRSAFGGWALYDASLLKPGVHPNACKHDDETVGCEHWSLSECLEKQFNATLLVATSLVVDWEGCDEKQQHMWDGWSPPRGVA